MRRSESSPRPGSGGSGGSGAWAAKAAPTWSARVMATCSRFGSGARPAAGIRMM
jgi:hypothetical protein